jgi:transposase InsO family protein
VTRDEIIYQRRLRVLEHAAETGNVSATCRVFGISRTRFYEWRSLAQRYGVEALMPKARRRPQLPNATPTHVVNELLTIAVTEPTLGCRRYADRLAARGYGIGKTTVQKLLNDHGLAHRSARVGRAAAIAAMTGGLVTEPARNEPFGFCHFAARPGDLVAMDSFYIGKLKGVGPVYQLTAIDTATRWAMMLIVIGPVQATHSAAFVAHVVRRFRKLGISIRTVLTDNGPEYVASGFRAALAAKGIAHHRIPPRSPNHNAVCERFQGTALQECWRPAFHRRRFSTVAQLQAEADAWLIGYHHRRPNHSDFMRGRTPTEVLASHRSNKAS